MWLERTLKRVKSKEVTLEYLTKRLSSTSLLKYAKNEQKHISEIKTLRKENKILKKKNENLFKFCESLYTKINDLENDKNVLRNKCDDSPKSLLQLTKL